MHTPKIRKAVIPAAGLGTRLRPITRSVPKEMLPVGRKPVIHHVVDEMMEAGIEQILMIVSRTKTAIVDYFDQESDLPIRIYYVRQPDQKGLAHAVALAEEFVGDEDFLVALGDTLISSVGDRSVSQRMVDLHVKKNAGATIAVEKVAKKDIPRYGIVKPTGEISESFRISELVEKPTIDEAPSDLAIASRYCFKPDLFKFIKDTKPGRNDELQLTDSIQLLLDSGASGWCVNMGPEEIRYDIGSYETYREVFLDFVRKES